MYPHCFLEEQKASAVAGGTLQQAVAHNQLAQTKAYGIKLRCFDPTI
jgi:hypothetical protein